MNVNYSSGNRILLLAGLIVAYSCGLVACNRLDADAVVDDPQLSAESDQSDAFYINHKGEKKPLESLSFYEMKLLDKSFVWDGPSTREDRVPSLHAARALAYIGDESVPVLFRALRDKNIDVYSITDALRTIGFPVQYFAGSFDKRDPRALEYWWEDNRLKTQEERSAYRVSLGLPPVK